MRRTPFPVIVLLWATTACGASAPPAPSPSPGGVESITGRERIGWDQAAGDATELATFRYAVYVDSARSEIADVSCGGNPGAGGFACSGRLPALSSGGHTLELASFFAGSDIESARSSPLRVTVSAITAGADAVEWGAGQIATGDGLRLRLDRLVDGLDAPVDAALLPDGRLLVVERSGRVQVIEERTLQARVALPADAADGRGPGPAVSIAIDPDFRRTRFVYAVQVARAADAATVFSISRFRELRGVLAQRAVIFETRAPSDAQPGGVVRFGPDGKLYAALGNGKLLRLNPDGSTPRDQAGTTPAIADGIQSPRGLGWHPDSGLLWIADEDTANEEVAGGEKGAGHVSAVAMEGTPLGAAVRARHDLADGARSLAFFGSDALVASARGRYILRLGFRGEEPTRIAGSERWLEDRVGAVRVVLTGPDGALYFCTDNALGRLTPLR